MAGYAMLGADLMLEGLLGLFGTYRNYMEAMISWGVPQDQAFILMALGHQINSFLLGLFFAHPKVYRRIPFSGPFKGLIFGFVWNLIAICVATISHTLGAEFMGIIANPDIKNILSLTLLHLIWGGVLGILYNPPDSV